MPGPDELADIRELVPDDEAPPFPFWYNFDGAAPLSTRGLFGWTARVWSPGGDLHASGGGHCLYRKVATSGEAAGLAANLPA